MTDPFILATIETYIIKEQDNMSLDDISLVINSLVTNGADSKIYQSFIQKRLTSTRIHNFSTLAVVLDLIGKMVASEIMAEIQVSKSFVDSLLATYANQVPYMADYPNIELAGFISQALTSLTEAGIQVPQPILAHLKSLF